MLLWHDPGVGTVLVIILPAVVVLGIVMSFAQVKVRRAPFPSQVAPDLDCPFCGRGMRHGRIMHAGEPVGWEPNDAPRPRVWLAKPGSHPVRGARAVIEAARATVRVRGASICDVCEAVVLDPRL